MPRMFNFPYRSYPYYNRYYSNYNRPFYPNPYTSSIPVNPSPEVINKENRTYEKDKKESSTTSENTTSNTTSRSSKKEKSFPGNLLDFLPTSLGPLQFNPDAFTNQDEPVFELFGIKLYLDDIIILGILFFLYEEEVDDQMLYISLFLLLLS